MTVCRFSDYVDAIIEDHYRIVYLNQQLSHQYDERLNSRFYGLYPIHFAALFGAVKSFGFLAQQGFTYTVQGNIGYYSQAYQGFYILKKGSSTFICCCLSESREILTICLKHIARLKIKISDREVEEAKAILQRVQSKHSHEGPKQFDDILMSVQQGKQKGMSHQ